MTAVFDPRAQTFRSRSFTLNNFNRLTGWGPESRILLNTSSKKTFRSLLGATGRFPVRPESGDSAQYFLKKNLPVAFQAAGKSQYRLGLLPTDSGISIKNVALALAPHFSDLDFLIQRVDRRLGSGRA